jgi:hypothetical protein
MGENQQPTAWDFSRLGNVIDRYVDRQLNNPQIVHDASDQYGIAPDGSLYHVGQAANSSVQPVRVNNQMVTWLLIGVAVYFVMRSGK